MRILRGWFGSVGLPGDVDGVGKSVDGVAVPNVDGEGVAEGDGEAEVVEEAEGVDEGEGVTSACDATTPTLRMIEEIAVSAVTPRFTLSSIHQKFPYMLDK